MRLFADLWPFGDLPPHSFDFIMAAPINQSGNAAEVADVVASALVNTAAAGRFGKLRMHGEELQ